MMKRMTLAILTLTLLLQTASGQYHGWRHSGSLYVLTTPEGANLPATASEAGFPLLVRLHKDWFDFSQAKAHGEDIRFAAGSGTPLAYEIDEWDPASGAASIWIRVPAIKGNARQEIKMYWGKPDAASQSSGSAVFNASNGYLSVWHMNDPVKDEVGTLESKDTGTASSAGIIGKSRRFDVGKGINCGENIMTYPTGASPHSSEAWLRAEEPNATVMAWGNEHAQGKVVMQFASPPHIRMDCYFSGANVASDGKLPMSQWVHVVHTYKKGDSRIYVNGLLAGESRSAGAPLAIKSPARMYIGGWYDNYRFVGDIDEVRVSKVTRSADWVRMEYENQKPLQTLVGPLVQPGCDFSLSEKQITLSEGQRATGKAKAGGAQKVYWIVKSGGPESIAAVDRLAFALDAGRVARDESLTLQFKAIYADGTKTRDIPVTIKKTIPDPAFTLQAPANWDGRKSIEVTPQITNLAEMQAKGAGDLKYDWTVSGLAVIKQVLPGKLLLKRAQNSGMLNIKLVLSNGGTKISSAAVIAVKEPEKDAWVQRTPDKDEKPVDNQFYARDDKNEGTLYYNGVLDQPADAVFLKVYAGNMRIQTASQKLKADKSYAFTVTLKPGLIKYKLEFGAKTGGTETVLRTVTNLVCGDAYLIDGQSNALATDTGEKSPAETSDWIRSYGHPQGNDLQGANLWCNPVWKAEHGEKAELGYWGMELAKRLVKSQKIPIFIINGAVGGTRIDQHQRSETNPTDLSTIYGRMLWRVRQARLTHGIRGVIWHQGESDQGSDGPGGGYGWETYQQYFLEMAAAWKEDFPNIQHYYLFQIWPNSCSMGSGHGDMLREVQRSLPRLYSNMDIMSTLGIKPAGPCHYPLTGWAEFARLLQPLIERDNYGKVSTASITAPNLKRAYYTSGAKIAIALEFDQPVVWKEALAGQFYLDGAADPGVSGEVSGNVVTLKLPATSAAKKITYLKEMHWSQDKLLLGANGIAALSFADVEIASSAKDDNK